MGKVVQRTSSLIGIILSAFLLTAQGSTQPVLVNVRVNDPAQDQLASDNTTQNETTIAAFGNTLVVSYNDTGQYLPLTKGVSTKMGYAVSTDGGQTFQDKGRAPVIEAGWGRVDPVLAVDQQGNFYFVGIQQLPPSPYGKQFFIGVSKSVDGGQTFSRPTLLQTDSLSASLDDKPWIAVDGTEGPFQGNIYISWSEYEFDPGTFNIRNSRLLFSRSTDGGKSFALATALTGKEAQFPGGVVLAVGPNGEVYTVWVEGEIQGGLDQIKIRRSVDGGLTWGAIQTIAQALLAVDPEPPTDQCQRSGGAALKGKISAFSLPSLAVDRSQGSNRGRVYIVYNSASPESKDNSNIFLVALDSDLNVVMPPKRVNDDTTQNDQFQPAIAVSPDGIIGVMFYDRRLDPNNLQMDVFLAISRDGGATFEPNRRVSDVSFDVPPIAGQPTSSRHFDSLAAECYIGEYNGIVADKKFFYLVWGDNRNRLATPRYPNGRPDPDVYFAKVPITP